VEGVWSLHTSVTSGWRASNPDPELIGRGEGGTASGYTATSTAKNFGKGDNSSWSADCLCATPTSCVAERGHHILQ